MLTKLAPVARVTREFLFTRADFLERDFSFFGGRSLVMDDFQQALKLILASTTMSGRARGSHIWLTLREMRIAKMDKKIHIKPCTGEVRKRWLHKTSRRSIFNTNPHYLSIEIVRELLEISSIGWCRERRPV